jgi:aminoglycoside phosphotransferase (APT) family kinase protein
MNEEVGRLLAIGNVAKVYEYAGGVVKLYKSPSAKAVAFCEAALHAAAEAAGLPVPRIRGVQQIDERWGLVFDRVEQASFAHRMKEHPHELHRYLDAMVRLQLRIHATRAIQFPSLKPRLAANIAGTALLGEPRRGELLSAFADMPDGDRLCHGDFHPLNILGDTEGPTVIDWADARCGEPAADACRTYVLLRLHVRELAAPYLDAYCRAAGISRRNVLDWLPYVASAKLAEDVTGERDGLLQLLGARPNSVRRRSRVG